MRDFPMSPMINEMVVQDRIREARQRAERHRVRRSPASARCNEPASKHFGALWVTGS